MREKKRIVAMILVLGMLVTTLFSPAHRLNAAEIGTLNVSNFSISINGEELTDGMTVHNGDSLKVSMNWSLNSDDNFTSYVYDMGANSSNILFENVSKEDFVSNGEVIGEYEVKDNKMYIYFNSETFMNASERNGGAAIDGKVNVSDASDKDGEEVDITLGQKTYTVIFDANAPESTLSLQKSAENSKLVKNPDGTYTQKFKVKMTACNGDVKNISLTDIPETGYESCSSITVNNAIGTIAAGSVFDDMGALNRELNAQTLGKDTSVELSYSMTVNPDVYLYNSTLGLNNTIKGTYTSDKGNDKEADGTAWYSVNKPTITKEGTFDEEKQEVIWTVTIDLKDFNVDGKDFDEIVSSVIDKPGNYFNLTGFDENITSLFKDDGNGVYKCTYELALGKDYKDSSSKIPLSNEVTMTIGDYKYTAKKTVTTPGTSWIEKEYSEYDPENGIISWKVTLKDIPEGVKDVKVSDIPTVNWTDNTPDQKLIDSVIIDNKEQLEKIDDWGGFTSKDKSIIKEYANGTITFNDDYIASHVSGNIEILFSTKVNPADVSIGTLYKNTAKLDYTYKSDIPVSFEDSASYKQHNALDKSGNVVDGTNEIEYSIKVLFSEIENLEVGKDIIIEDVMDSDLKYIDSVSIIPRQKQSWGYNQNGDGWANGEPLLDISCNYDNDNNKIIFKIPVTHTIIDAINAANNYDFAAEIKYRAELKEEKDFVKQYAAGGTKDFSNSATGTYDGNEIGKSTTTTTMTPAPVVKKVGNYDKGRTVKYEVLINENGYDLVTGDEISATDSLGVNSMLAYDMESIKVYKIVESGFEELDSSEYEYEYKKDSNSIVFKLPDETPLKITYSAKINITDYVNNVDNVEKKLNATNSFSLSGVQDKTGESKKVLATAIVSPSVWATFTDGEITVKKYWTNDNNEMVALDGSSFKLMETAYDKTTGEMVDKTDTARELVLVDKTEVTINKIKSDVYYVLYETKAKSGFVCNDKPYYFVLPSENFKKTTMPYTINYFDNGEIINYENKKEDPTDPTNPTDPTTPTETTTPEETTTPMETTTPEETTTPTETTTPEETTTPTETTTPEETTTPTETTTPEETTTPTETTDSIDPSYGGVTVAPIESITPMETTAGYDETTQNETTSLEETTIQEGTKDTINGNETQKGETTNKNTGYDKHMYFYLILVVCALAGLVLSLTLRTKKEK